MTFNNVLILGDSYSTFGGFIPESYEAYYSKTSEKSDLHDVRDTWWHSLFKETNSNLIHNNSWSGSPICYTGYGGVDCSKRSSFIVRFNELVENGFFVKNEINTIFVFGGTNDSCANSPLGELKFSDWTKEDLYNVFPAICCLISKIKEAAPNAKLYWLINEFIKPEIIKAMITACEYYKVDFIRFKNIEMDQGHPTVVGMRDIKNQIIDYVSK